MRKTQPQFSSIPKQATFQTTFYYYIPDCSSTKENWMCLNCGIVLCGRYENGHALNHSTINKEHTVCLNTLNCSVYCYKCDDFVINDTSKNLLDDLRQEFRDDSDSSSEASTFIDESSSSKSQQETASTTSSSSGDSGWEEPPAIGRKLRPRKRTISSDSSDGTKRKSLRKV